MSDREPLNAGFQVEESVAEAYEEYVVPTLFVPWADRLVEMVGVRAGDRLLDVACGTGIVARRAGPHVGDGGTVVGVDINEDMLGVAEKAAVDARPSIEWRVGDAAERGLHR